MEQLSQYDEVEAYLLGVPKFTSKNTMEDTRLFYGRLGCPGSRQKIIHVAGTNGKGSVCSYLNTLLMECGFKTGMFTSPHLCRMTERIRINGECVDEEAFVRVFHKVYGMIQELGRHPSFFELLFFMAMLIFEESGADYIILETGLGGRLDATNCISRPEVSIITSIGLDHTEYLGDTVARIAAEKAGIIKPGRPVVCLSRDKEAYAAIAEAAECRNSAVFAVEEADIHIYGFHKKAIDFSYKSKYYDYIRLILSTSAIYQAENAALAIRALEVILPPGVLKEDLIKGGVQKAFWEGRMEEVLPGILVDGAHNEDGIRAFLYSLCRDHYPGKRTLLFAAVRDKQYESMLAMLLESGLFGRAYAAPLATERGAPVERLTKVLRDHGFGEEAFGSAEEAFSKLAEGKKEDERVYAVGSLYLVGQIKALLKED